MHLWPCLSCNISTLPLPAWYIPTQEYVVPKIKKQIYFINSCLLFIIYTSDTQETEQKMKKNNIIIQNINTVVPHLTNGSPYELGGLLHLTYFFHLTNFECLIFFCVTKIKTFKLINTQMYKLNHLHQYNTRCDHKYSLISLFSTLHLAVEFILQQRLSRYKLLWSAYVIM
jgi:hypothetical protein